MAAMAKKFTRSLKPGSPLEAQPAPGKVSPSQNVSIEKNNLLSIIFGVIALGVLVAYSFKTTAPYVIGENLVLAEVT